MPATATVKTSATAMKSPAAVEAAKPTAPEAASREMVSSKVPAVMASADDKCSSIIRPCVSIVGTVVSIVGTRIRVVAAIRSVTGTGIRCASV
jgi:hypothetical protein